MNHKSKNNTYQIFSVSAADLEALQMAGRKIPTRYFVMHYLEDINKGIPYDIILSRIQQRFGQKVSYHAFCTSISRYVNGKVPKTKAKGEKKEERRMFGLKW